jgi:hypothetical protein
MPNTREKLVELIAESRVTNTDDSVCINGSEYIADHLIANGVTVQKWIPVTERLPEKHGKYLVLTPNCTWLIWYDTECGFYDNDPEWGDIEIDDVTHWMPLPEPPKGD